MNKSLLFDNFTRLYRPYIKILQPILDDYNLHPAQWFILKDIATHPNTTLVQISKRRSIEKPTTRKILKVLHERQWLNITPGEDKRQKLLSLSHQGEAIYHQLKEAIGEVQKQVLQTLQLSEEELDQTIRILDQVYDALIEHI